MTTAIALIRADQKKLNAVGEQLAGIPGITEVYSVGGQIDFVAIMRLPDNESLAELVTEKITKIEGISNTQTMVAFRAFSRYDLASMFDIS
ncbi:Lrp/AsnC family transcriptional regulator [Gaoshiqia sediminis]|uniref:Lrp/AsnC ligand binding domain-containing protein n=1 Tax=Gaoshiqia sediminis TaxID=2986998 RepID=A0AA41Y7L1_9BACT|nr:Lrp/AsnC ligand binding domain-containing protein [Gaoshiqia sediminis]MCW0483444.1 Lrp/AsnC ligand binding domain-containing protein [Gaoshiqia sediminis]